MTKRWLTEKQEKRRQITHHMTPERWAMWRLTMGRWGLSRRLRLARKVRRLRASRQARKAAA